jgi:glycosyltransferase involved in cell wall biosynthesis
MKPESEQANAVPDLIVEPSALYPPWSGVGYYIRELLKAYRELPDHYPLKFLAYRFILKSKRAPREDRFEDQARDLGGSLDIRTRFVPSLVYDRLRRWALRPPIPLDLFKPAKLCLYFFPNYVGEPLIRSNYVPVIFDFGFLRYPQTLLGSDHLYLKRYVPRTLRRAGRVIVISECIKKELQLAYDYPAEKISVVCPAVDHAVFRPDLPEEACAAVLAKYGLQGGYIFSLSTLEPRKNFPRLIEAYARLPENLRRPLVVAGGQGWKNEDISATIRRLGLESNLKFLGYIPEEDRAPLMREAGLFVLPSLYEGFGMPVLEAMACGTPVVTSARGALPEVGGETVVYVDPIDPDDIARGILSILENPKRAEGLAQAGLARAATFQWSDSARVLADVFRKVAAGE